MLLCWLQQERLCSLGNPVLRRETRAIRHVAASLCCFPLNPLDQERLRAFVTCCLDYCHSRTLRGRRSVRGHLISTCSPALSASHVKNRELKSSTRRFNLYFLKPHQTLEGICMQGSSRGGGTEGQVDGWTGGLPERLLMSTDKEKRAPPPSTLNAGCLGEQRKIDARVSAHPRKSCS